MSSCSEADLDLPGVYIYINKANEKKYIGSAIDQTILQRQQQHLCSASREEGHVGKFDSALSRCFNVANWGFYAIPLATSIQSANSQQILTIERELILKCRSTESQFGYNTQLPGGR